MDYRTKPTSRNDLRQYAKLLRRLFHVPETGGFPVLQVLDQIPDVFKGSNCLIVPDCKLPAKTMARCFPNGNCGFTIEIKESVYMGAYNKKIGAFLGFICHEICHVFLFNIGFTPICERSFDEKDIPTYCRVEWQAKALCGEVMIPYEESRGMTAKMIEEKYHVSKAFAQVRRKQERR